MPDNFTPLEIEYVNLQAFRIAAGNPKSHDVGLLIAMFQEYGFRDPVGVDGYADGLTAEGHGRLEALATMQLQSVPAPTHIKVEDGEWYVPAVTGFVSANEKQFRGYRLAHNSVGEKAGYDDVALLEELKYMNTQGAMEQTGFSTEDLQDLQLQIAQDEAVDDPSAQTDRAEELREKWGVERGQLWQIGRHGLLCGDSTNADDVARLMGGANADAVVTDPPYGINHDTDYTRFSGGKSQSRNFGLPIHGDGEAFDPAPYLEYETTILWGANNYFGQLPSGSLLVWDKRDKGRDKLLGDGEVAWCNKGHGIYIFNHAWNGFVRDSERGATKHPTQKPVALFAWCFGWLDKGDVVFDPYAGSGPIMAAAEQLNHTCYSMEIEPKYVAVTLERMADMDLEPTLIE